jgi:hypothetical protein
MNIFVREIPNVKKREEDDDKSLYINAGRGGTMKGSLPDIIPPLSVVQVVRIEDEPNWNGYLGRIFRIGYYNPQDGLDCVWLVDDKGEYRETMDQEMIKTHFKVLELSNETDLFGVERPVIGPR